jgi:hypothetical protein
VALPQAEESGPRAPVRRPRAGHDGCLHELGTARAIFVGTYGAAVEPACRDVERIVRAQVAERPFVNRAELAHFLGALLEHRREALRLLRLSEAVALVDAFGTEIDEARLMNQFRFVEEYSKCLGFYYPPMGVSRVEYLKSWPLTARAR